MSSQKIYETDEFLASLRRKSEGVINGKSRDEVNELAHVKWHESQASAKLPVYV